MSKRVVSTVNFARGTALVAGAALLLLASVSTAAAESPVAPALAQYQAAEKLVAAHLATFDELDYVVFTQQQWQRLHESHSKDVTVYWPDGHATHGIEKHIEDLAAMFVYAPDTRIKVHTVKVGQGEWTAVIGIMEGTFTKPMPTGDGKSIPPTGKPYKITMCTVGHWTNGVMNEEYLFWDNLTFMKQIGVMQ
jgi:predicted ester cyclase